MEAEPVLFQCNADQKIFMVSSEDDAIYLNMNTDQEVDIDKMYQVDKIREIRIDQEDGIVYIIANRYKEVYGVYIVQFMENDPFVNDDTVFLVKWETKLTIGDVGFHILRDENRYYKEIVISYKTIYMNVLSIIVLDLNHKSDQPLSCQYDTFQLWESEVTCLLLDKNNDFVIINKDGISIVALGSDEVRLV